MQTPELAACQSAPAQAVRLAWARRLRRLTPLPRPDLFRGQVASGVQLVGLFNGLAELVVAVGAQTTPTSRPHLVHVAEVRDCASRPFCR